MTAFQVGYFSGAVSDVHILCSDGGSYNGSDAEVAQLSEASFDAWPANISSDGFHSVAATAGVGAVTAFGAVGSDLDCGIDRVITGVQLQSYVYGDNGTQQIM